MATGVKCKNCYHYSRVIKNWCIPNVDSTDKDIIRDCQFFAKETNADRIRAMSDEELAQFIWNRDIDIVEKASKAVEFTFTVDREKCFKNVLDWLKKEVEE